MSPRARLLHRNGLHPSMVSYLLPAHWACYFIDDDPSDLDEAEIAAADGWWQETFSGQSASCVDADEDYGFSAFHDASGFSLPAYCSTYRFLLHEQTPPEALL